MLFGKLRVRHQLQLLAVFIVVEHKVLHHAIVTHGRIRTARHHFFQSQRQAFITLDVGIGSTHQFGNRDVACGACFHSHQMFFQIFGRLDGRAFVVHHNHLGGVKIRVGKRHGLFALFGDGDGGNRDVRITCFQGFKNAIEWTRYKFQA